MLTRTNSSTSPGPAPAETGRHVPGEVGVWVFILGEMVVFATLFVTYLSYRAADPGLFAASQMTLNRTSGVILTLILLSASFLVVLAVRAVRAGAPHLARRLILAAIGCGAMFIALKALEYHDKVAHGLTPQTNDFYMLYFVLTGLHLFHVVLGLVVLVILYRLAGKPHLSPVRFGFVEGGACFWHMVELLWIVLFPLLYLVR